MANNFIQWNPTKANQETDAQYAADSVRAGGATPGALLPSRLANKVLYQLSTFIYAFAAALAAKGFNVSDADPNALAGVFANILTNVDISGLAPLLSPAFQGVPTAPNPPAGDNSTKIATTSFARGSVQLGATGYVKLPNGLIIQWITGPAQGADGSEPALSLGFPIAFPTACYFCSAGIKIGAASTATDSWYQIVSFNNNQVVVQRQHGDGGSYQQITQALVIAIGN